MIKILREAAHDYPWFLKSIMGTLALAFVITMGWWGFGDQGGNVVASVGDQVVPLDEYRRAYENTYRFYKDKGQNDIKDEFLKQFVLEQLIDNRMWLHVAKEMGLSVSDEDLRKAIMQRTEFQKNGSFDPESYRRLLAANRAWGAAFGREEWKIGDLNFSEFLRIDQDAVYSRNFSKELVGAVRIGAGIGQGMIRLGVGLEHLEDLKADLARGLDPLAS